MRLFNSVSVLLMFQLIGVGAAWGQFNSTVIQEIRSSGEAYPLITSRMIWLQSGWPLRVYPSDIESRLEILEKGNRCIVKSLAFDQTNNFLNIRTDFLVEPGGIRLEDMTKLQDLASTFLDLEGFKTTVDFYAREGNQVREFKIGELNREIIEDSSKSDSFDADDIDAFLRENPIENGMDARFLVFIVASSSLRQEIDEIVARVNSSRIVWYAFLVTGSESQSASTSDFCLLEESLRSDVKVLSDRLKIVMKRLFDSQVFVTFTSARPWSLDEQRSFVIKVKTRMGAEGVLSRALSASAPVDRIRETYVRYHLERIEGRWAAGIYAESIDSLRRAATALTDARFDSAAFDKLAAYGQIILDNHRANEVRELFRKAEEDWKISPDSAEWYRNLKSKLILAELSYLPAEELDAQGRIDRYEELLILFPASAAYKAGLARSQGDLSRSEGDNWSAARNYRKSLEMRRDSSLAIRLSEAVRRAILSDFSSQPRNYARICANTKSYKNVIASSFDLRFRYGKSCAESGDFDEAATEFEWLVLNWEGDQQDVTWEETFDELQELYTLTLRFDAAYGVNKRIYRERGDSRAFFESVSDLRLRTLVPVAQAYRIFREKVRDEAAAKQFLASSESKWAPYVESMQELTLSGAVMHKQGKTRSTPTKEMLVKAKKTYPLPAILVDSDLKDRGWVVQMHGGGFLSIEFSTDLSDQERIIASEIQKNPTLARGWKELAEAQQQNGMRCLSQLVALMYSLEEEQGIPVDITEYSKVLITQNKNRLLLYMVKHDTQGAIQQNPEGFEKSSTTMEEEYYKRSSSALALMTQLINVGDVEVVDIAVPLFAKGRMQGVVRFGFYQL